MSDVTNIEQLPSNKNIHLETNDLPQPVQQQNENHIQNNDITHKQLSQEDINKIISGVQTASQHNLTALPTRDIPSTISNVRNDIESTVNYIPKSNDLYINETTDTTNYSVHRENKTNICRQCKKDNFMIDYETPLLIIILYILFQLPIFNSLYKRYLSFLFLKDGNPSMNLFIIKGLLFGTTYYGVVKIINYLSD